MLFASGAAALDVKVKDPAGTENADGLTDKQLAIQRWFAELTFLNTKGDGWNMWYRDDKQLGLDSYRYSLAFMAYAAGAMVYKTPAYTEVTEKILDDSFQRMIDRRVWDFIKVYWDDDPHFPDPVAYENIMYSGHVAQILSLYESISGKMKYSKKGWVFAWDDDTIIHYTGARLMQAMYGQIVSDPTGGIPCEPDTIFIICNDHPHNAFHLYDAMHGTHFADLDEKWRAWMEKNGKLPQVKGKAYLKISYLRDRGMWTTGFGTPGSDGWALAWMPPWTSNLNFVCDGWKVMYDNKLWRKHDASGGQYLMADAVSNMFGVDDYSGTAFYPLVEVQCISKERPRTPLVFRYFEKEFGTFADLDKDGFKESYYYDTEARTRLWVTANLANAMVVRGLELRHMYRSPFFQEHRGEPKLEHAPYPDVLVKKAAFDKKTKTLSFTVLKGKARPAKGAQMICSGISAVKSVSRGGKPFKDYKLKDGSLTITADIDKESSFVVAIK